MKNISVGIADDHRLFREGINMIVTEMREITLDIKASGGEDLLKQLQHAVHIPDVILLDLEMEGLSGIDTLIKLRELKADLKVIILSMHTEPIMVSKLMKLGADGYLKKDAEKNELELAIRTVYEKGSYINEHVSNSLLLELRSPGKKTSHSIEITSREKEVLTLICQECTTQEIGEKLFISDRTVEGHRKSLCAKLSVKNTAGLVKKAILLNLIEVK
jgi:DNA-binding NarL/FixJ family response regulator